MRQLNGLAGDGACLQLFCPLHAQENYLCALSHDFAPAEKDHFFWRHKKRLVDHER